MNRKYLLIGGLVLAIALIAVSVFQWNEKVETTTEKAKEDIIVAEEKRKEKAEKKEAEEDSQNGAKQGTNATKGPDSNSDNIQPQSDGDNPNPSTDDQAATGNDSSVNGAGLDGNNGSPQNKGTSIEEIKSAYRKIFSDLEIQESSRVDQLVVQAKADYVSGKLTKSALAVKYQDAAVALERNADQTFNLIYNQLLVDLEKYGHSSSEATEFRSEYQSKKQQRLKHVIRELDNF